MTPQNASQRQTYVSEKAFLFDASRVEFFPNLQIENNNVKAGHSAITKKFRDDEIFYLTSRGLQEEQARQLLLESFIEGFNVNLNDVI